MKTANSSTRNDFTNIHARIGDLIGLSAVTTHLSSKSHPHRSKQPRELRRRMMPSSPRSWNETLSFAADG